MVKVASLIAVASVMSFPTEQTDMVRYLLKGLPEIIHDEESAAADIGLWVRPDGRIESCEIVRSTGEQSTMEKVCPALKSYVFNAPRAGDGREIHAYLVTTVSLFPDRSPGKRNLLMKNLRQLREASEEKRFESSLSPRAERSGQWTLTLNVSDQGIVSHCQKGSKITSSKFAAIACEKLVGSAMAKRFAENGEAVPYLLRFGFISS